jgi:signal transduction histidine kinase
MIDRVDALGGTLDVHSEPGKGTTITDPIPARQIEPAR